MQKRERMDSNWKFKDRLNPIGFLEAHENSPHSPPLRASWRSSSLVIIVPDNMNIVIRFETGLTRLPFQSSITGARIIANIQIGLADIYNHFYGFSPMQAIVMLFMAFWIIYAVAIRKWIHQRITHRARSKMLGFGFEFRWKAKTDSGDIWAYRLQDIGSDEACSWSASLFIAGRPIQRLALFSLPSFSSFTSFASFFPYFVPVPSIVVRRPQR